MKEQQPIQIEGKDHFIGGRLIDPVTREGSLLLYRRGEYGAEGFKIVPEKELNE